MGRLILLVAFVVELALAAFCLTTRSPQEKARSVIRILGFAAFVILTLTSVIQWSFRWFGLAALLFLWSVRSLGTLGNAKAPTGGDRAGSTVFRAITAVLLLFGALTPALVFPPHESLATTGPYSVASVTVTYTDPQRIEQFTDGRENRRVNAHFWFPQNRDKPNRDKDETYPLVVFSHGGLGTETSNESLYRELASHGYVVCSIGHPYHAFWTKGEDGRTIFVSMDYFREIQSEDAKRDKEQSLRFYRKWMETRTGDINFVIDMILERAISGADGVYRLITIDTIGVIGHSLGGAAALAIPRQRDDITAVIALESPFLYDIVSVEDDEFVWRDEVYPVPVLNIYSDSAWSHLSEWAQYAENFALLSTPSGTAHSLHLPGAGHFSLTDLPLASPLLVRLLEGRAATPGYAEYVQAVNSACLDFLERYLKGQGRLTSRGLP